MELGGLESRGRTMVDRGKPFAISLPYTLGTVLQSPKRCQYSLKSFSPDALSCEP